MRGGLHFLINVDEEFVIERTICKNVSINSHKFKLYVEFKTKCLVSPSKNYTGVFTKECGRITTNENVLGLIEEIIVILEKNTPLTVLNHDMDDNDSIDENFYSKRKSKKKKPIDSGIGNKLKKNRVINVQDELNKLVNKRIIIINTLTKYYRRWGISRNLIWL